MKTYRAPNKRIIQRGGGGRFRRTTLADIGLACCETCGAMFTPAEASAPFIDPREVAQGRRFCPDHGGKGTATGFVVDGGVGITDPRTR